MFRGVFIGQHTHTHGCTLLFAWHPDPTPDLVPRGTEPPKLTLMKQLPARTPQQPASTLVPCQPTSKAADQKFRGLATANKQFFLTRGNLPSVLGGSPYRLSPPNIFGACQDL